MTATIGFLLGLLIILFAILALIRLAFKDDIIWGLLCLLIVPIPLYLMLHPSRSRYIIAFLLIGITTAFIALLGGADQKLDLKARAEALGISELPGINRLRAPVEVTAVVKEAVEEEEEVIPEAEEKVKVEKTEVRVQQPRFITVNKSEVAAFTGSTFKGKTYDGRLIQGLITAATAESVTLSRSVSQGSASFDYNLAEFESIMVANP